MALNDKVAEISRFYNRTALYLWDYIFEKRQSLANILLKIPWLCQGIGDYMYDERMIPRIFYLFDVKDKSVANDALIFLRKQSEYLDDYPFTQVSCTYPLGHPLCNQQVQFHMVVLFFPQEHAFKAFIEGRYKGMYDDHKIKKGELLYPSFGGITSEPNRAYYATNGIHDAKYIAFIRGAIAKELGVNEKDLMSKFTSVEEELDIKPIMPDEIFNYYK